MCWLLFLLVSLSACGGQNPAAPTSLVVHAGIPQNRPLVVVGQSNAVYLFPYLTANYAPGATCVCRGVTALRGWDVNGDLWPPLVAALQQPALAGMVIWEGEQDALEGVSTAEFVAHLTDFFARVRAIRPGLLIVVVEIRMFNGGGPPLGAVIRTAQEHVTAADPLTMLINVDDLAGEAPPQEEHLIPSTYPVAAQRIVTAIRTR
jgi:hypothetical protein